MFSNLGVNVDPLNGAGSPSVADLASFGWIRLVARPDAQVTNYIADARQAGIRVVAVLASQSFPAGTPIDQMASTYANDFEADCWQLGNEPDAGWSPTASPEAQSAAVRQQFHGSSWCMDPPDFAALVETCASAIRNVRPTATIVTAGLTSGSAIYLLRAGSLPVDGVAVHPYGQHPDPFTHGPDSPEWAGLPGNFGFVGDLLGSYGAFGFPLWVTEVGVSTTQATSELQGRYCEVMMSLLRDRPDVVAAFWFCYSDGMVPEFGLLDGTGAPKPSFDRFPR